MAKPKGGTLHRLFEVSEQDRRDFVANIESKLQKVAIQPNPSASETGIPFSGTPDLGVPVPSVPDKPAPERGGPETVRPETAATSQPLRMIQKLRIRRALKVQDGHSLGEQLVLTTLWNEADVVPGKAYRRITIGYRTLSAICGLTVNNCKANLKSLQAKMAIEAEAGYSNTAATTYLVYSFADILSRREAGGLTHVLRSRGAMFVDPESGIPILGTLPVPLAGIPDSETGVPAAGGKGVPEIGAHLRIKKEAQREESSPSSTAVVGDIVRRYLNIDDDAVRRIVENCRTTEASASPEEIAHFAEIVINKHRSNRRIDNWAGFLMTAVAKYFQSPATELATFRAAKVEENRRGRELAQEILDNVADSDQSSIAWAKQVLG